MTAEDVGVIIALASLAVGLVGLIIHALRQAVAYGELRQRVATLEQQATGQKTVADTVIRLEIMVSHLQSTVEEMKTAIERIASSPSRRSRSTDNG